MASVTAYLTVGTPNPNEHSIYPDTVVELWEGSRATWVVRSIKNGRIVRRVYPKSPEMIGIDLVRILDSLVPRPLESAEGPFKMSIVAAPLPQSSLLLHLDLLKDVRACDVHILEPVYSRTYSSWSACWDVRDASDAPRELGA